mmetsp:Transcript_92801/g.181832  ORF Transcript_92801/g.181832 Transcript_92801/m.181832 type:complete len:232 (+) Transcript_92801:225-920(+)
MQGTHLKRPRKSASECLFPRQLVAMPSGSHANTVDSLSIIDHFFNKINYNFRGLMTHLMKIGQVFQTIHILQCTIATAILQRQFSPVIILELHHCQLKSNRTLPTITRDELIGSILRDGYFGSVFILFYYSSGDPSVFVASYVHIILYFRRRRRNPRIDRCVVHFFENLGTRELTVLQTSGSEVNTILTNDKSNLDCATVDSGLYMLQHILANFLTFSLNVRVSVDLGFVQ